MRRASSALSRGAPRWSRSTSTSSLPRVALDIALQSSAASSLDRHPLWASSSSPHAPSSAASRGYGLPAGGVDSPLRLTQEFTPGAAMELLNDPLEDWNVSRKAARPRSGFVPDGVQRVDPFALVEKDMAGLTADIIKLLSSSHPVLAQVAKYFFDLDNGKKVRPAMVLLISHALRQQSFSTSTPYAPTTTTSSSSSPHLPPIPNLYSLPNLLTPSGVLQTQYRLSEISELIHTASLFHDDVIDKSPTRRNMPTAHATHGNKLAILAGDFLLARASVALSRLRCLETVEVMSTSVEHLVKGEVMQMSKEAKAVLRANGPDKHDALMSNYLRKNFYKTSSLMAHSCLSAALLSSPNPDPALLSACYKYGKHLGTAFQLIDDVLDFDGDEKLMGKPLFADLSSGIATAPVLFAMRTEVGLEDMVSRAFERDGDVQEAVRLVRRTDGIERTKELAWVHAEIAADEAIKGMSGGGEFRDGLVNLALKVVNREK